MKTFKANKVAVIKNTYSAEEMCEIQKEFVKLKTVRGTLEELVKAESLKNAKG